MFDAGQPVFTDGDISGDGTSTTMNPLDLAHMLGYLGGRITEAKDGGNGHGGSAELDGGATPAVTTVAPTKARTSINELR